MISDIKLKAAYVRALANVRKKLRPFISKMQDVMDGKIAPPEYYVDNGLEQFWRQGFVNSLMRQYHVEDLLVQQLQKAGLFAGDYIKKELPTIYGHGRQEELDIIIDGCKKFGFKPQFLRLDKQAIEVAANDAVQKSPFSLIKINALGQNDTLRRTMQQQMAASIASGEGVRQLEKRIAAVYGKSYGNAKLCAQTESTRVRNEARYNTYNEAQEMGIEMERIWHCRFQNTRDGHAEQEGKPAQNGGWMVYWESGKKCGMDFMRFPGDPTACAANVCNCHCSVQTRVKSASKAVAAYRAKNDQRRRQWLEENAEQNDWRDRLFHDDEGKPVHPYARKGR